MTGHEVDVATLPELDAPAAAEVMARRTEMYRHRIVQVAALVAMVVDPVPQETVARLARYADELCVREELLEAGAGLHASSRALLAVDFDRNGYLEQAARRLDLTPSAEAGVWAVDDHDPALAARWAALADLPPGTVGRGVHDFYLARGFEFPGRPGSAPPLLAQHDWVHVMAGYGTTVENELEVFGFIARANDDPRAFSLLAMVVRLFETGALARGAGLFEADRGHLSRAGMTVRLGDAMRRGALCRGSTDFLAMDWFAVAERPIDVLRAEVGLPLKADGAQDAGSVGPWQRGGISPFQHRAGQAKAERDGREYSSFGAEPDPAR